MKTTKRLLAALLCVCLLVGTLAISGSAADAPKTVALPNPVVTVTRAEELTVYELTFDFIPNTAESDAPVFTGFDADAVVQGEVELIISPPFAAFTAKPTAYDAQEGLLTVSLYDEEGNEGFKMMKMSEEIDESAFFGADDAIVLNYKRFAEDAIDLVGSYILYAFQFPQGLLTGDNVQSEAGGFALHSCSIRNMPLRKVDILNETFYIKYSILTSRIVDSIQKHDWVESLLIKFFETFINGLLGDTNSRLNISIIWSIVSYLLLLPFRLPTIIRVFRAVEAVAREYDPQWSFGKLLFGGLGASK